MGILSFLAFYTISCESFLEIESPKDKLISETVYEDKGVIKSALANIYYQMINEGIQQGAFGTSTYMSIYADELDYLGVTTSGAARIIYEHNIQGNNVTASTWWKDSYRIIYSINHFLEGINNSSILSTEEKNDYKGQALFVRAFLHTLLVEVYGDVPYIKTSDYIENGSVSRMPVNEVYENIREDLTIALPLLDNTKGERTYASKSASYALLARTYLYTENWDLAATAATQVINKHTLELDLSKVFLKESPETIWQLENGNNLHTTQASNFIGRNSTSFSYVLTTGLLGVFENNDARKTNWVGINTNANTGNITYYPYKYKDRDGINNPNSEYSIIFRLAEQYLIRAEARAQLGNITGAQNDLNAIRNRAGLANTLANNKDAMLEAIIKERRIELFTEHGHRWYDLKRTGKAAEVIKPIKPNWQDHHILFPIPESEIRKNQNLTQNPGY
ncbi:hypothetical protein BTO18_07220 [Polaribacter porphyrae]|uniref:RagB/SusD family nutrient uptake outer membrane protein n=1 Tax=Polaribacter porphyrae TaxID=1137780 RepID=A0A2S7WTZ4_9FLAO|nr:hypothetical protein BTO18_07220 [Polaribacter porphyrae]